MFDVLVVRRNSERNRLKYNQIVLQNDAIDVERLLGSSITRTNGGVKIRVRIRWC